MYPQDNISAMLGGARTPEEERMAQALRRDQAGGDMLALSTIGQISKMGQGMSANATAGAKQMGTLAQAREQAAIAQTRHDESMGLRNRQLTQSIAANEAAETRRITELNEKIRAKEVEEGRKAEELLIKQKTANINSTRNNHTFNNLGGILGQEAAVLKAGIAAGIYLGEGADAATSDMKIGTWASDNGADEAFAKTLIADTNKLALLTDLPASGLADAIVQGGEDAFKWSKYMHGLTGRTGLIPHTGKGSKIPRGRIDDYDIASKGLSFMLSSAEAYEPFYAAGAVPVVNAAKSYIASKVPQVMGEDSKERERWFSNLNQFYTMPERHEMFGAALTPTEEANWLKSAITPHLDDGQIRWAMATRLYIMRKVAEKQIKTGLAEGYPQETLKGYYDYLADTEMGRVNPDTDEGRRLLREGWNPGDPVEWYAEEGAAVAEDVELTDDQLLAMSEEEFAAWEAAQAAKGNPDGR